MAQGGTIPWMHKVEVDQSRKIERAGATILAFSNGISHAILIPTRVKEIALLLLRQKGKSKTIATLLVFSAGLCLLLKDHLKHLQKIVIDEEYTGHEANIKSFLLEYLKKTGQSFEARRITFARIGKKSPADQKAGAVRRGKDKKFTKISMKAMLRLIA
jgi:D-ribose pyranose/furanose isomerase RbsD